MNTKGIVLFISGLVTVLYASLFVIAHTNMCPVTMGCSDSSVFSTMGMSWTNGLVPYRDVFDHKGPFLYFINALGYFINGEFYGVVYIQIFCMALTCLLFLICNKDNSITWLFFLYFIFNYCIIKCFEGGNLTEEYSIIFNTTSAFVFIKKYKKRFLIYGICGAIVFFIRPNLAAPSLALVIIDYFENINKSIFLNFIYLMFGFIIIALPIFLYFYIKNGFNDFISSYFLFNMNYTKIHQKNLLNAYIEYIKRNKIIFIFFIVYLFPLIKLNKMLFIKCIFIIIFSFIFMCISGRTYPHYFLVMIAPLFTVYVIVSNYYKLDSFIPTDIKLTVKERLISFDNQKLSVFCILSMCILSIYLYNITQRKYKNCFDTTKLQQIRVFFAMHGIDRNSKILNLASHSHSKIFYILHVLPQEKDFFPQTARISGKFDATRKKQMLPCSDTSYDLIVIPEDKTLSEQCPYTLMKNPPNPLRPKIYIKKH